MRRIPAQTDLANDLANALLQDVRDRGLQEGDRYYTTEEAGHKFSVCKETARKAMKILAGRDVLVRLRRRGTFVGSMAAARPQPKVARRRLLVLTPPVVCSSPQLEFSQIPHFLDQAMNNIFIQSHILPLDADVSIIREMVDNVRNTGHLDGIVSGSRTREVHDYMTSLDVPAVVLGTLDSGQTDLSSLDLDYNQAGRLLAEYVIGLGHTHVIAQLANNFRGDHHFADSIADVMSAAHLPPSSLRVRTFCGDLETVRANFRDLLSNNNRPTAIITRGRALADTAAAAADDVGLCISKDIEIVWSGSALKVEEYSPYVNVQSKLGMDEIASMVAKMLEDQREGRALEEKHVFIPAELCMPSVN